MGSVYFYHLTRRPLEATLPVLVERALAQGWPVAIRGTTPDRLVWLDQKLWLGAEESFLPHGLAGGEHDALQPVLLGNGEEKPANNAMCLILVDGAQVRPEEAVNFERICVVFDGADGTAVELAREQWRVISDAGVSAQYWSEESGKWAQKA